MDRIEIVEVGPRDGIQNISQFIPTPTKVKFIRKLLAARFECLELGSFVSPKAVPQMSDMENVIEELGPMSDARGIALVPNTKGAQRAVAAGFHELLFVISMSEAHNMSNVRRSISASVDDLRTMLAEVDPGRRLKVRVGLATSFHCPFQGIVDEDVVIETARRIVSIRDGLELAIADTTGMALPGHVKSLCGRMIKEFGSSATFGFHGHDTAGFGIANVLAALEAGIISFDAAVGGLGGCPFAPGATGNVATEDIVYLFARMGVHTGIDLGRLLDASDFAATIPGAVMASHARAVPRERLLASAGWQSVAAQ